MLKRVDPLRKELKDLETKAEDTRLKGEEITKIIAELEASIAKYKEEYAMLISDANVIKNDLTTVEKKVRREREGGREEGRERGERVLFTCAHISLYYTNRLIGVKLSSLVSVERGRGGTPAAKHSRHKCPQLAETYC